MFNSTCDSTARSEEDRRIPIMKSTVDSTTSTHNSTPDSTPTSTHRTRSFKRTRRFGRSREGRVRTDLTPDSALLIAHMAHGHRNKEIAIATGRTRASVRGSISRLLLRFDCRNRTELVLWAIAEDIPIPYPLSSDHGLQR